MLLKLNVGQVALHDLAVKTAEVDAYEQRWSETLQRVSAYLSDSSSVLEPDALQPLSTLPAVDVYLSHAVGNPARVMQLAVALEATGLSVFVGSGLWQRAEALSRDMQRPSGEHADLLDTPYARQGRTTRASTSICTVVAAVQQRLIESCELFIHLEHAPVRLADVVHNSRCGGSTWALSERLYARHATRRGRPPLRLEAMKDQGEAASRPLLAAQGAHVMEWERLLRAIVDTTGFPSPPGWRDNPVFLDHLYGKLPLSAPERALLGW